MIRRQIDPYFLVSLVAGAAVLATYVGWSSLQGRKRGQRPGLWPSAISDTARRAGLSHVYGSEEARYVLREISDFRCDACARAETTVVRTAMFLADAKVIRLVVYDLPGPGNAVGALVAATCVATIEPSKYWPYRSLLFASHDEWMKAYPPEPSLITLANSIGIDSVAFKACVEKHGSGLSADANTLAKTVVAGGLNSTPGWSLQDSVFLTPEISTRLQLLERKYLPVDGKSY